MGTKIFKTLDEQIQILIGKGLVIDDIIYAKDIVLRENYFFLMGYRHLFLDPENPKHFKKGTTYTLSQKYGYKENDYLRPSNYNQAPEKQRQVNDLLKKMKRQIRVNGGQHEATKHYINNYGYIPLWIVVKVLSFGITSELYTIMKLSDQREIAKEFNIDNESLAVFLPILSNYRNLCAHEDILFEHRTQKFIPDNKYHERLNIPSINGEYIYGKGDLFSVVIIFKYMLSKDDFRMFINEVSYELDKLAGRLEAISIDQVYDRMGFPVNYKSLLDD